MLLRVVCPAKVNLFLAVGLRDARGYHPIRTIFQAVDLCDVMTIREGSGKHRVEFSEPSIPADNTVTRTLRLLAEIVELPPLHIKVEKRIPAETGLGGGSSNAAGIIRAARAISGSSLPAAEVQGIAEAVGADVPFFLVGGKAKAEGYGQKLAPMPDGKECWFVIARPNVGCGTAEAYRRLDNLSFPWRDFPEDDEPYNDFERVAPPESLSLIARLKDLGATGASLCGSGSGAFGIFGARTEAETAKQKLVKEGTPAVWAVRSLTRAESD